MKSYIISKFIQHQSHSYCIKYNSIIKRIS